MKRFLEAKGKYDVTVIESAIRAQKIMDAQTGLSSDLKHDGKVTVADIDIPGISKQMAAYSLVFVAGRVGVIVKIVLNKARGSVC